MVKALGTARWNTRILGHEMTVAFAFLPDMEKDDAVLDCT